MRQARFRTSLILVLLVVVGAPSPRLTTCLLTGPLRSAAPDAAKKPPQFRGRNRIGAPVVLDRSMSLVSRVGDTRDRPSTAPAATVPRDRRSLALPRFVSPAPVAVRLRC